MADDIILTPAGKQKPGRRAASISRGTEMPTLSPSAFGRRAPSAISRRTSTTRTPSGSRGSSRGASPTFRPCSTAPESWRSRPSTDAVGMGSTVTLRDLDYDDELTYTIVDPISADPTNDKISISSPVGKALVDAKIGDTVEVTHPRRQVAPRSSHDLLTAGKLWRAGSGSGILGAMSFAAQTPSPSLLLRRLQSPSRSRLHRSMR